MHLNNKHDPSRTTYATTNSVIRKNYSSALSEKELNNKIYEQMSNWLSKKENEYGYYYPARYFTNAGLPWLLQKKPDKKSYYNILTSFNKLLLMSLDNNDITDMIVADLKDKDNYRNFGDLNIHKQLTLNQLDRLQSSWSVDTENYSFLGCYIKKLAPLSIQVLYV